MFAARTALRTANEIAMMKPLPQGRRYRRFAPQDDRLLPPRLRVMPSFCRSARCPLPPCRRCAELEWSFHLGRCRASEKSRQRRDDALVPLTQKCGQDVFANPLTPQMIAAIAARVSRVVEVDPVVLSSSRDAVASVAYSLTAKPEAPLQAIEIDAARGIEVDQYLLRHVLLPIQALVKTRLLVH
jgi:hypothetical protein